MKKNMEEALLHQ